MSTCSPDIDDYIDMVLNTWLQFVVLAIYEILLFSFCSTEYRQSSRGESGSNYWWSSSRVPSSSSGYLGNHFGYNSYDKTKNDYSRTQFGAPIQGVQSSK